MIHGFESHPLRFLKLTVEASQPIIWVLRTIARISAGKTPWKKPRRSFLPSKLFNPKIPELDACAVAEEADVAGFVGQAGMLFEDGGVFFIVEVGIDDGGAVEFDGDVPALGGDF